LTRPARAADIGIAATTDEASAPLLTLRSISKTYAARDGEPVVAIKDVSCSICSGEFVSILGPSGCGK
jgi:ABC-type Fe3+/spermidine/putrescine transport system ATPase subunit